MNNATITISGAGIEGVTGLNVQVSVEAVVNVDAAHARRTATAWVASEVGNMLLAGEPTLVIARATVWRLPVLLTSSTQGVVGEVGTIDVDAANGEPLVSDKLRNEILNNVSQFASPPLSAVG